MAELNKQHASGKNLQASVDIAAVQAAFLEKWKPGAMFMEVIGADGKVLYKKEGIITKSFPLDSLADATPSPDLLTLRRSILANMPDTAGYPGNKAYWMEDYAKIAAASSAGSLPALWGQAIPACRRAEPGSADTARLPATKQINIRALQYFLRSARLSGNQHRPADPFSSSHVLRRNPQKQRHQRTKRTNNNLRTPRPWPLTVHRLYSSRPKHISRFKKASAAKRIFRSALSPEPTYCRRAQCCRYPIPET